MRRQSRLARQRSGSQAFGQPHGNLRGEVTWESNLPTSRLRFGKDKHKPNYPACQTRERLYALPSQSEASTHLSVQPLGIGSKHRGCQTKGASMYNNIWFVSDWDMPVLFVFCFPSIRDVDSGHSGIQKKKELYACRALHSSSVPNKMPKGRDTDTAYVVYAVVISKKGLVRLPMQCMCLYSAQPYSIAVKPLWTPNGAGRVNHAKQVFSWCRRRWGTVITLKSREN